MNDLDPHDSAFLGLGQKTPDLPSRNAEQTTDLVLGLIFVVVELGHAHGKEFRCFVHGRPFARRSF